LLAFRQLHSRPWHSPPHWAGENTRWLITAACYEHCSHIGWTAERITEFSAQLISQIERHSKQIAAWCVLPNHYHVIVFTSQLKPLLHAIGQLHGRTSRAWNLAESAVGRKVWCACAETAMKSDAHYWATLNYVHHNPVRHKYCKHWQEWPFSSANAYLDSAGRRFAMETWRKYPIDRYGDNWDPPSF
jgi:putative transposase